MSIAAASLDYAPVNTVPALRNRAYVYDVAEKVCWVAFVAIVGTVLTVACMGIPLTGYLPAAMFSFFLLSLPAGHYANVFHGLSLDYTKKAEREEAVHREYQAISGWGTQEVSAFFREHRLTQQRGNREGSLLPLIARFQVLHRKSQEAEQQAQRTLARRELELNMGARFTQDQKEAVLLRTYQSAYRQHEGEAIPLGFEAALVLHAIENPQCDLHLEQIGTMKIKPKEWRSFGKDDYFIFHARSGRPPITLTDIERDLSPSALRALLFPV